MKKEILLQAGNQFFLNEKNEIISRKDPNLKLSFYDCVRQLRVIHQRIQDLKVIEDFYVQVLSDWEKNTQNPLPEPKEEIKS